MTLVLVGGPGAGKTSVAGLVVSRTGRSVLDMAEVLRGALSEPAGRVSRAAVGPRFIATRGVDGIARAIFSLNPPEDVVIDAIRFARTCDQLRAWRADTEVWFVEASLEERRERVRGRLHSLSREDRARQLREYFRYEAELPALRDAADRILTNAAGPASLEAQVLRALDARRRASA